MIDVNRQKFWIISSAGQFDFKDQAGSAEWNETLQVLRLKSTRSLDNIPSDRVRAMALSNQLPVTLDDYGTWAYVDETERVVLAGGAFPDSVEILTLPTGERVVDMTMNPEGMLYLIGKDTEDVSTLYLINLRGSKEDGKTAYLNDEEEAEDTNVVKARFPDGENQPDRIVALTRGGALLLDREHKVFWQIVGKPLREQPTAMYRPTTPRPCMDGPETQELIERPDLILPEEYEVVSIASNPDGDTAVLLFPPEADKPAAVLIISDKAMSAPVFLDKAWAPFSIGWVRDNEWALLFDNKKESFVYPIPFLSETPEDPMPASGRRYPLNRGTNDAWINGKFCNGLSQPVRYPSTDKQGRFMIRPLYPLSFQSYATQAEVQTAAVIDSGEPNTVWHRLFLEAHIPKGTGVTVCLAAGEEREVLENEPEWVGHHFGSVKCEPDSPEGVWMNGTSETPFFPGLLYCKPQAGTAGIFGVLIQRPGYVVRTLKGRYLNIKIIMNGGGQATPEVAALRIYHPRFSYLDRYLPELYRETNVRQKINETGMASSSDFMQRFLCLFESVLTPIEDKVAASHMLTNPMSVPSEALDWLGQWIGLNDDIDLSESRKRLYLSHATDLYRKRGTMKGLSQTIDLITGNKVSRGDIVLLEDFRLRRTFATILGADYSVGNDPLLMGEIPNANSYVGETLFLGEEEKKEFMALYSGDIALDINDRETVDNFYARLANRLTVLIHQQTDNETLGLIGRIISMEAPSHIEYRIVPVSKPLLIGMYSILGVDTYIQKEPERRTARVGHSYLGRYDFIRKLPVLDDRLEP